MADDDRRPAGSPLDRLTVHLIGSDGTELGVVTVAEALRQASEAGLKLIELGVRSKLAVCKMMNAEQFDEYLRATQGSTN